MKMTGGRPEDAVMASCDAEMIALLSQIGEDEIAKNVSLHQKKKKKEEEEGKTIHNCLFFCLDLTSLSFLDLSKKINQSP